ncbi:MAG TPA: S41 family peptidase [Bryobacteraceae bacterium]|jgi:carboxyl-terminal processing protease|nr:S41 family peptidase [Bryobacteraceae bacterium]
MNSRFKVVVVTTSSLLVVLLLAGARYGRSASPEDTYRHLAVYTEVLSRIKSDYVEEPDMKSVTLGAVNGLLESVDPYASYLNADQYKQYLKSTDQNKADVGLLLSKRFGYVNIVSAIPGSPAATAGLTTGDVIETINGVATRDMPLAFAQILLQGDPGTTIELGILRLRKPEPSKVTLTRQKVTYPAVTSKLLGDGVGLITVSSLETDQVAQTGASVRELEKQGAKRLILDLRNCASGSPESGIKLASLFLSSGLVTYTQGQKSPRQNFDAAGQPVDAKTPLVVLTNRGTADGAEIAAAALQDDKRAQVVGERTYGDASIRKAITMDDGAAVILSVAKYYSPAGKAIQDTGVVPAVMVAEGDAAPIEPDDDSVPSTLQTPKPSEDLPLKKAIELLTKGGEVASSQPSTQAQSQLTRPQ